MWKLWLKQELCVRNFEDIVAANRVHTWPESSPVNIPVTSFHQLAFHLVVGNCNLLVLIEDRNSHFFQESVLIECIRDSPSKLIMIQVPAMKASLRCCPMHTLKKMLSQIHKCYMILKKGKNKLKKGKKRHYLW